MRTAHEIKCLQLQHWSPENEAERIINCIEQQIYESPKNYMNYPFLDAKVIKVLNDQGFKIFKKDESIVISW